MPYLMLLSPSPHPYERPPEQNTDHDQAEEGPVFGPVSFVHARPETGIEFGGSESHQLHFVNRLVFYGGKFYGSWSVIDGPLLPGVAQLLVPFDPDQAEIPEPLEPCECELPGYFHCGVPGILAHLEHGRIVPGFHVERCDACQRFESDAAAEAKLRELGLFVADDPRALPADERQRTYSVHCYATVRVKLPGIPANDERDAARRASERFDWDRYRAEAEYADEITEFLVDIDGDEDFSRSKRFTADLQEVQP